MLEACLSFCGLHSVAGSMCLVVSCGYYCVASYISNQPSVRLSQQIFAEKAAWGEMWYGQPNVSGKRWVTTEPIRWKNLLFYHLSPWQEPVCSSPLKQKQNPESGLTSLIYFVSPQNWMDYTGELVHGKKTTVQCPLTLPSGFVWCQFQDWIKEGARVKSLVSLAVYTRNPLHSN